MLRRMLMWQEEGLVKLPCPTFPSPETSGNFHIIRMKDH